MRESDALSTDVDEEQVALSAWDNEDASMGISIINIFVGIFALVVAASAGYNVSVVAFVGVMALALVALGYATAHSRRTAGATSAVIEFRAMRQTARSTEERPVIQPPHRRSIIDALLKRRATGDAPATPHRSASIQAAASQNPGR